MKTIRDFKIKENQKNYEHVALLVDDNNTFYVKYKWTSMREYRTLQYNNYQEAMDKYIERKKFAWFCN